jgi:uncharacterized protein YuzB (UPF0349 family)
MLKFCVSALALLEGGEECFSEIAQEQDVSLAEVRALLVCQAAEHV